MESIQLAQMLADLSDLHAAQEARAANALVNANKDIAAPPAPAPTKSNEQATSAPRNNNHQRVHSASGIASRTASPAKFDKMGRRIFTPPLSRTSSAQGSVPGTPRSQEPEDDVDRATSLMALYDIRAKLKQQDNMSLNKAREKIAALQARQQADKKDGPEKQHYHYTYPKSS